MPVTGRCVLRLRGGGVAQSVVPEEDVRLREAMRAHGVKATTIPYEPRCEALCMPKCNVV